ncbi:Hint domain-containing protein [Paracoccus homiensis]|uniref:Hint domain-containing protein n=1 Tax=Paracoccus homiensis TaxID=364199 RepID=UPI00398D455C
MVEITLYQTQVVENVVVGDSILVTIDVPDPDGDGTITREEWSAYLGINNFGHVGGTTEPPALFSSTTGALTTGTLYSPVAYTTGEDIKTVLDELAHNKYAPSIESLNICYLSGTLIATPDGEVPVETLRVGDLVMTRDHGPQPLRWVSATHVTLDDLDLAPNKRPVRIAAGCLGNGLPRRDVEVSPQHRIMVTDAEGQEYLISARHMLMAGAPGISLRPLGQEFTLHHIACDDHQILSAEGAPMESFFTGPMALRALALPQRTGLVIAFPSLALGENPMTPARPFINRRDYARMIWASQPG